MGRSSASIPVVSRARCPVITFPLWASSGTVHLGELSKKNYKDCAKYGGPCNESGLVEVWRHEPGGGLLKVGEYVTDEWSLPYLEFAGAGAVRLEQDGFRSYRVEAAP
jgi:hypothetical protein